MQGSGAWLRIIASLWGSCQELGPFWDMSEPISLSGCADENGGQSVQKFDRSAAWVCPFFRG